MPSPRWPRRRRPAPRRASTARTWRSIRRCSLPATTGRSSRRRDGCKRPCAPRAARWHAPSCGSSAGFPSTSGSSQRSRRAIPRPRARRWRRTSTRSSRTSVSMPSSRTRRPVRMSADRPTVLVTWMDFDPDGGQTGARLRAAGLDLRLAPKTGARSSADIARLAEDAVAAIVSTDPFDREVFAAAPSLRAIARVGVGTDSIDLEAATEAGVLVMTTPGANRETTADHALALILAALRRVVEHDTSIRRGEWLRAGPMTPWELNRTTVGLLGFGEIGQAVARRLRGFDVALLVSDPAVPTAEGIECVSLPELLRRSDVVSLHLPLTDATAGLI